jgi:hypothetical protein
MYVVDTNVIFAGAPSKMSAAADLLETGTRPVFTCRPSP